jgi:uncharacterized protein (TIGR03437 family)
MRRIVWLLLVSWPLPGQFSHLATDDIGDRVWFSSALRIGGTQQSLLPKIFMADALGNVQLVAEAAPGDSYSILSNPEVSGDGKTLAYTASYNCPPQQICKILDYTMGVVSTANGPLTLPGTFHLSRNGRYMAREGYSFFGPTGQFEIIDLTTRQTREIPVENFEMISGGGRQVTSQGMVLAYADSLWLFGFDGSAQFVLNASFTIPAPGPFFSFSAQAAVDDAGDKVVYQSTSGCEIDVTGPSNAAEITTLVTSNSPCTMQMLSADGSTVLFISSANFDGSNAAGLPEPWLLDTMSKSVTAVGHDPAGIAEATLSGDGKVVWAITLAGRLIRVDRPSGVTQEIIPQTTAVDQDPLSFPLTAAPGALVHLTGRGLAAQSAASSLPLATTVGGIQLLADGQPLRLLSVSPADVVFQVPWDMTGTHALTLAGTQSPFEEVLARNLRIQPTAPSFWYTAAGFPVIAHQDFHGLVSPSDPAHPDEILHLYLTGLGAVTPPVGTGEAAPSNPLSVMVDPVYVFWAGELPINFPMSANVLFVGLAPGLVGMEQVDVQVPHESPAQLSVTVQSGSASTLASFPVAP